MDYEIIGSSMQSLRVSLKEGERIYTDSGKLLSKSSNVVMTPRMVGGMVKAIERKMTGATGMLTEFKSKEGSGDVSLSGVMPGKVKMIQLAEGESFVAESYAFLAAEDSVTYSMQTLSFGATFFGGEGIVLQRLSGPGMIFIHIVGDIVEREIVQGEEFEVDPGHIAGYSSTLQFKVRFVDNVRTAMFGGVGLLLANFTGHGRLYMHSISRYKFAAEIFDQGRANAPKGAKYEQ
ncbi:MAG: TIGR00266 family protein [Candidatus Micrarchaeota archaeon]|nr:TIGR00266 family protein [Candidatus Micrarchaeota archaeon]MDE1847359.1 TIGR00266 family protein [Candidatus Micrarchaeota archaeon]MDE1863974.1 TIGR00266 family protein [Candidatus Micrarchaeota archaeon]